MWLHNTTLYIHTICISEYKMDYIIFVDGLLTQILCNLYLNLYRFYPGYQVLVVNHISAIT